MASLTIRITRRMNDMLDSLSAETGILKSSLILYAINYYLRSKAGMVATHYELMPDSDTVRMTLRIPAPLKKYLMNKANEHNTSANELVLVSIHVVSKMFWKDLEPLPKEP